VGQNVMFDGSELLGVGPGAPTTGGDGGLQRLPAAFSFPGLDAARFYFAGIHWRALALFFRHRAI